MENRRVYQFSKRKLLSQKSGFSSVSVSVHMYVHVAQYKIIVSLLQVTIRKCDNCQRDHAIINTRALPAQSPTTRFWDGTPQGCRIFVAGLFFNENITVRTEAECPLLHVHLLDYVPFLDARWSLPNGVYHPQTCFCAITTQ